MWSTVLRIICHSSAIAVIGIAAQVHGAAADDVPHCSQQVQEDIAALCAGSFSALIQQPSGAEALLCMPAGEAWNGDLVVFARGNASFPTDDCKLASMTGQLRLGETSLPGLVNQLGFGFATSTCSADVLAVGECKDDLTELATNFQAYLDTLASRNNVTYGAFSGLRYLTGASMGGLVATQLIEEPGGLVLASTQASVGAFDGALAACGPIGDFQRLITYQGDLLVLTDCVYRDELAVLAPDGLVSVGEGLKPVVPGTVHVLDPGFCPALARIIDTRPGKAAKILRIMAAAGEPVALDPSGAHTIGETIADVLCSDILRAIPVMEARFGGNPYDNLTHVYVDPLSGQWANLKLNRCVARFAADVGTEAFETSGQLTGPLVTLHTVLDPRVPFSQNVLYGAKVLGSGQIADYAAIPSPNFGHCAFNKAEVVAALAVLVFKVSGFDLLDAGAMLEEADALDRFNQLVEQFHDGLKQGDRAIDRAIDGAASAASDVEDEIDDAIPFKF
jgi:hypothetical protein